MKWLCCRTYDFTEQEYAAVYEALSPSRRAHIDAFRHAGARQQSLAGELALRKLLRQEGIGATPIRLPSGQPALSGSDLHVSIAHCDDRIVCAVSRTPVGIDIEKLRPLRPGLAERVCTPEELHYVQSSGDPDSCFLEIWTAKEAYFKMKGTGITDLQSVNVLPLPRQLFRQDAYYIQILWAE